jgi:uncharacterized membrane protein
MSEDQGGSRYSPAMIALAAVLIALTAVFTIVLKWPIPGTPGGYFNLSDVAVVFVGLVFGPWAGLVAGGVGAALGDLLPGILSAAWAPQFAPLSLIAHGLEGFLIGLIGWRRRSVSVMILAVVVGGVAMVGIYLLGEALIYYQKGWPPVLAGWLLALSETPWNIFQMIVGGVLGIGLALAVRRAYPDVDQIGRRKQWKEE